MTAAGQRSPRQSAAPAPALLRFAMLGMIEGNGHPWSWSAIINGYDREKLAACPYPVIPQYLNARPAGTVNIPGAHLCGTAGQTSFKFSDTYTGFRRQLVSFIDYVRSGVEPYAFAETVELMSVLIAGITSKKEGGRRVLISEIQSQLSI